MTSPGKKGYGNTTIGHLFSNPPEYISDPFDRAKNQDTEEIKLHRSKSGKDPLHLTFGKKDGFTSNYQTYHIPDSLKPKRIKKSQSQSLHTKPFMSGTKSSGFFTKHPEYMSDPIPPGASRKNEDENKKIKPWTYTHQYKSVPSVAGKAMKTFNKSTIKL